MLINKSVKYGNSIKIMKLLFLLRLLCFLLSGYNLHEISNFSLVCF